MSLPKIISLFSGAGGLDLGFQRAGYVIAFASDVSQWAIETHKHNFPQTHSIVADLITLGPGGLLDELSTVLTDGESVAVIGGPPCQGFSRANTSASSTDPRNQLPLLYLDCVKALQSRYDVKFVLFENVLGIRDTKHRVVFDKILFELRELGFADQVDQYSALDYGVPQVRKRVIIVAFQSRIALAKFSPTPVLVKDLTVADAIKGFPEPTLFSHGLEKGSISFHPNHWTMQPRSSRFNKTKEPSAPSRSFRRLVWDKPSPTVAYGHREIHVHPEGHRRLSIYEAMVLQGFPEDFVLEGTLSAQVEQISNAVPPPLAFQLARAATVALKVDEEKARYASE